MYEVFDTNNPAVQKYYGKYPGLVVDNSAPEGANHRGELKVEVAGILEEAPGKNSQRSMQVVAKPCFPPGFFFIPEKGTQVWVEFAAGNINEAIWTGVWYPTDKSPKTTEAEFPTIHQKVIRSTVNGHTIELNDEDGSIRVKDKHGNCLTLNQSGITLEASTITLKVKDKETPLITLKDEEITLMVGGNALTVDSSKITATAGTGEVKAIVLDPILDWLSNHKHLGYMGFVANLFPASMVELKMNTGSYKTRK